MAEFIKFMTYKNQKPEDKKPNYKEAHPVLINKDQISYLEPTGVEDFWQVRIIQGNACYLCVSHKKDLESHFKV